MLKKLIYILLPLLIIATIARGYIFIQAQETQIKKRDRVIEGLLQKIEQIQINKENTRCFVEIADECLIVEKISAVSFNELDKQNDKYEGNFIIILKKRINSY